MSVDHASGVAAPKSDPVFLHVRAGMTVIVDDNSDWRMADVIWVDGGARNPKAPTLFQVADVDTGVINWVNIKDLGKYRLVTFKWREDRPMPIWDSAGNKLTKPAAIYAGAKVKLAFQQRLGVTGCMRTARKVALRDLSTGHFRGSEASS